MPTPRPSRSWRPGEDAPCEICGTMRRWIQAGFPALSNLEPCPVHVKAPDVARARDAYMARNAQATDVLREIAGLEGDEKSEGPIRARLALAGLKEITGEPVSQARELLEEIRDKAAETDTGASNEILELAEQALTHLGGES